jgi:uncharacterized protein (TIGR01777 family)
MKVVLTGATGLIGKKLAIECLKSNIRVAACVRDLKKVDYLPASFLESWEGSQHLPLPALKDSEAVVHLAGESIAQSRWTDEQKKKIIETRIQSTKNIVDSIQKLPQEHRPRVLVMASAIGYYGEGGDSILTEASQGGQDFLSEVVQAWEEAAKSVESLGVRLVFLRTGLVLAREGGVLSKTLPVILGSGRQWMSWIHIDDVVRFIQNAILDETYSGPYNLVSPQPVTNADFTRQLAKVIRFPAVLKAPSSILKMSLGEMSGLLLTSQRVEPKRLLAKPFAYQYSDLESALNSIYSDHDYLGLYHLEYLYFSGLTEVPQELLTDLESHFVSSQCRFEVSSLNIPSGTGDHEKEEKGILIKIEIYYRLSGGLLGRWLKADSVKKSIVNELKKFKAKVRAVSDSALGTTSGTT